MAQQSLDRERGLPWEVLAQLGPAVTGAVFFSKPEAMKMIEEALKDYVQRGSAGKSYAGQGGTSLALNLPTERGEFIAKWLPSYNPLSQTSSVAAFSRWKDLYSRKGLPDPADFLLPTQAIHGIRKDRKGWWIIQPKVEHPSTLFATDPARVRGRTELGPLPKPGEWQDVRVSPSPLSEEVRVIETKIREHPVLGKKDPSGAPRFSMTDVGDSGSMGNVGIEPTTKKAVLYDLGTLINLEAKPYESMGGVVRPVTKGLPAYTLKQRRLPSTFKKAAGGGAAGLGISLLLGALANLGGGGE